MSIAPQPIEPPMDPPTGQPTEAPSREATELRTSRGVGQAYLLLAICGCLAITVGAAIQMWSPYLGLTVDQMLLFLLPAVLYVRFKGLPIAESLRWRPITLAGVLLSVLLGVLAFGVSVGIALLTIPILGPPPKDEFFELDTLPQLAVTLFCGSLLPGICEETLFRGAIQGTLERRGPVKAVLITSILFALFHLSPWNFLSPLFLGVLFGVVTLRSGSTVPGMIAHATNNATALTLGYLLRDGDEPPVKIICAILAALFVVAFPIYLLKTRHRAPVPGLLASAEAGLSWRALAIIATAIAAFIVLFFIACILGAWLT